MSESVTIDLWTLSTVKTYQDVNNAFLWCVDKFGTPGSRWQYGRSTPCHYGTAIISSPMEIEHLVFSNPEDALQFKLTFS